MTALAADVRPCSSCPYRRDTPSGVWTADEYAKLPAYDTNDAFATFVCHQPEKNQETVCRGWLTVHRESVAARLAVMNGLVTDEQRYAEVDVELYESGTEAAAAGMADVSSPGSDAEHTIDRIVRKQRRHAARR